jgi:uncharacterized membrane protein YqaE (UPF0057 family)
MSDSEKPICIPSVLGPMAVCFIFPPAFVFLHEMRKDPPFKNGHNIFVSIILTCFLYFPGLIHGLSLMRSEGTWTNNYAGIN